jgi:hypothetical protein
VSSGVVVAEFRAKAGGRSVCLGIIDHITPCPVITPVKELIPIYHEKGVDKVFVDDAAPAIGQVPSTCGTSAPTSTPVISTTGSSAHPLWPSFTSARMTT